MQNKIYVLKLVFNLVLFIFGNSLFSQNAAYFDIKGNQLYVKKTNCNFLIEENFKFNSYEYYCIITDKDLQNLKKINIYDLINSIDNVNIDSITNKNLDSLIKQININNGIVYLIKDKCVLFEICIENNFIDYFAEFNTQKEIIKYIEFKNGKRNGLSFNVYDSSYNILCYIDGKQVSFIRILDKKLISKTSFNKKMLVWDEKGSRNLKTEVEINELGQYNGIKKVYFENGNVKLLGKYKNNIIVGDWLNFDEKGNVIKIETNE